MFKSLRFSGAEYIGTICFTPGSGSDRRPLDKLQKQRVQELRASGRAAETLNVFPNDQELSFEHIGVATDEDAVKLREIRDRFEKVSFDDHEADRAISREMDQCAADLCERFFKEKAMEAITAINNKILSLPNRWWYWRA